MTSLERGDEWIGKLLDDLINARISKKPNEKLKLESDIFRRILSLRNGIPEELIRGDEYKEGFFFNTDSTFSNNENKLSSLYHVIFAINKYSVSEDVITKYDVQLSEIVVKNDTLPMWYELSQEAVTSTPTPLFRYKSKSSFQEDLVAQYHGDKPKKGKYELPERDFDILVRNDKYPPTCTRSVKMSQQLQMRISKETDPQYKSHPCEFMLIPLLGLKTLDRKYFSYGLRYIELYMKNLMSGSTMPDLMHLPIEFKTDGSYGGMQYETLFIQQMRYVINLMSLTFHNVGIGLLTTEYQDVSNEILLHILPYPYLKGKEFKKAFTPIGLYYGMDDSDNKKAQQRKHEKRDGKEIESNVNAGLYVHRHPYYNVTSSILNEYPYSFSKHTVCTGDKCLNEYRNGVYSNNVRKYIDTFFTYVKLNTMTMTQTFIRKRLLPIRPNVGAPLDIIFIRLHIGSGGYSHTHKLADFVAEIEENYEQNEKFVADDVSNNCDSALLVERLRHIGYRQTLNLIEKHAYPTAEKFKMMLPSFLTSKSAGVAPIILEMKVRMDDGRVETITQSMTSKTANAALRGESVFNIPFKVGDNVLEHVGEDGVTTSYDLITPVQYYDSLSDVEKERVREEGLNSQDLAKMNVSTIGSRATSGYRAIRAIFMVKLHQHLMQCSLVQPHVSVTTSRYSSGAFPHSLWINEHDYGRSILTTDQDGSDDVWARYIMASGDGRMILAAADATAWDQHVKNLYLNAYYDGIRQAITEKAVMESGHYMFKDGHGLSLAQVCEEFMQLQMTSMYIAEYGWEAAIVKVNFLTSGRLDTFMFNSIMNSEINKIINEKLNKLPEPFEYVALTVAGDDVLAILNTKAKKADQIEMVKTISVSTYSNVGHLISDTKTLMSRRQAEVAKRNMYFGMYYRDPNVQFYESEKSDKADNRLTRIRGQAAKQFEALRRSVSNIGASVMMLRMGIMLMYSFKYVPPRKANIRDAPNAGSDGKKRKSLKRNDKSSFNTISVKYYPPYVSCVVPTHVSGGIGMTFTGVSMNEVKFFMDEDVSIVDDALGVVSLITNSSIQGLQNAFVKSFIDESKYGIITGSAKTTVKLEGVPTFRNSNPTDTQPSMQAGMSLTRKSLKQEKLIASVEAINRLRRSNVEVQESMKYANTPELLVRNMAESIAIRYNRGKRDIDEVIRKLFFVDPEGVVQFFPLKKQLTLSAMYPIYTMFQCKTHTDMNSSLKLLTGMHRIVSQPDQIALMENYYGSRWGKGARLNLQGANTSLRKFITRSGLSMTAEQLMENMVNSGALNDVSKTQDNIVAYLTAVSGDEQAAKEYVLESQRDEFTWEDMLTAVTIAGSMVEAFDWSSDTVHNNVNVANANIIPHNVRNMIKYTSYMYMLQRSAFYGDFYTYVTAGMVTGYERVIKNMKPKTNKRAVHVVKDNDIISNMADFYERTRISVVRQKEMLRDENFE